jgi:hypothetical protein
MATDESSIQGLWASGSVPEDLEALLGTFAQSPIAAATAALLVALCIGVALLTATRGLSVAARHFEPASPTVSKSGQVVVSLRRLSMQERDRPAKQLRARRSALDSYLTRDNAILALTKRAQVLDLRLLGARSNASIERGPPGRWHPNSIAGRRSSKWYRDLGTRKAGLND